MTKSEWVKIAVVRFEGRLLRYTSRFVGDARARDIVQDAFLKLWQQEPEKVEGHLAEWLFTVCRNGAIDVQRKDKKIAGSEELENVKDEKQSAETSVENTSLLRFVHELPPPQQEVLRLKFQEDLSYKQISAITGHSVSHVGVLIHTAVTTLRRKLEVPS